MTRKVGLQLLLGLTSIGCAFGPPQPTGPVLIGDPLPGRIHLTTVPPRASQQLSLRVDRAGGRPGISEEFDEGEEIVAEWSDLPFPEEKWIELDGEDCGGTFGVRESLETDLLLIFTEDGCQIRVLGIHPRGDPHFGPE